jgi:hypothetical protein
MSNIRGLVPILLATGLGVVNGMWLKIIRDLLSIANEERAIGIWPCIQGSKRTKRGTAVSPFLLNC